jgi:hypothetical protein
VALQMPGFRSYPTTAVVHRVFFLSSHEWQEQFSVGGGAGPPAPAPPPSAPTPAPSAGKQTSSPACCLAAHTMCEFAFTTNCDYSKQTAVNYPGHRLDTLSDYGFLYISQILQGEPASLWSYLCIAVVHGVFVITSYELQDRCSVGGHAGLINATSLALSGPTSPIAPTPAPSAGKQTSSPACCLAAHTMCAFAFTTNCDYSKQTAVNYPGHRLDTLSDYGFSYISQILQREPASLWSYLCIAVVHGVFVITSYELQDRCSVGGHAGLINATSLALSGPTSPIAPTPAPSAGKQTSSPACCLAAHTMCAFAFTTNCDYSKQTAVKYPGHHLDTLSDCGFSYISQILQREPASLWSYLCIAVAHGVFVITSYELQDRCSVGGHAGTSGATTPSPSKASPALSKRDKFYKAIGTCRSLSIHAFC